MRLAAAASLAAVLAAAVAADAAPTGVGNGQQQSGSPFPSPSPSPEATATSGGYVAIFADASSGSGGTFAKPSSTSSPKTFPSAGGSGFTLDFTGRLSHAYEGSLRIQDDQFHAADRPVVTSAEGALLFTPGDGRFGIGIGYVSYQRSTAPSSTTGFGAGIALTPDVGRRVSPYLKLFVYPSVVSTYEIGAAVAPRGGGGLYFIAGLAGRSGVKRTLSPTSAATLQIGIGDEF